MYKSLVKYTILFYAVTFFCGCSDLERKVFVRRIDFEVDPKANKGNPFVCNVVVPYSPDLVQKLHGMDAQTYFSQLPELRRLYKDKLEIFSYDIIPGKSKVKQKIEPRSRTKAYGAYIFAKYSVNGKFAERLGLNSKIIVKFEEYKMTIYDGKLSIPKFDDKCAGKCPKKDLPKTDHEAKPKPEDCVECPPGAEYAMVCDDGTTEYYPKKTTDKDKQKNKIKDKKKNEDCIKCPPNTEYAEKCEDGTIKYYDKNNTECVECPEGSEFLQECDDGTVIYLPEPTPSKTSVQVKPNSAKNATKSNSASSKNSKANANVPVRKKSQPIKH